MKKLLLWLFIILGTFTAKAQDTLTFLQYNLLNYGNFPSYCPSSINNVARKTGYIGVIVHYVKPDIFTVNEISGKRSYHDYLLNNGLNTDGVNYYAKAPSLSSQYDYLVNMLYYNKNKLGLAAHTIAQAYVRDVDVYKLYYKSANLNQGDTTFIYCVVAHLKAGRDYNGSTTNQDKRKIMARNTMAYIATHSPDNNYMLMGDFNLYTAEEPAFQEFINYSNPKVRFNDPVNQIGDWHNNYNYRMVQSQSTHTIDNGCASSGGLDDRFDFILISNNVKYGNKKVKYVSGSFHVVGQDGKHFNQAVNSSPANTSVPANVLNALYNNSDHLPVTLKVTVNQPVGIPQMHSDIDQLDFTNPVNNVLNFKVDAAKTTSLKVEVFSLLGQKVMQRKFSISKGNSQQTMDVSSLIKGLYILRFTESNGHSFSRKLLKY
jgi:endonuclease/exonuclease/phosphatase family metal-dependent hydrolase